MKWKLLSTWLHKDYMVVSSRKRGTRRWTPKKVPPVLEPLHMFSLYGFCRTLHRVFSAKQGEITAVWEPKVIDAERRMGPSTLVPTDKGVLTLEKLCKTWASESKGGVACARESSARTKKTLESF